MVMEVLRIMWVTPLWEAIASVTESIDSYFGTLSTTNFSTTAPSVANTRIVDMVAGSRNGAFTAAGTYSQPADNVLLHDLTDGMGHGYLVATDNLFLLLNTSGFAAVASVTIKILYRWKNIGLQEYVGIVQSQQ
jgi:hypothetical protein